LAVNDLNSACASIRNHPIIFNVKAGETFTENVPAITVSTAASSADYILFQTDGSVATHPIIKSGIGTGSADAIVTIQGTNYIIFNGIDLADNSANTTATTEAEYGYYLITNTNSSSASIGAQNNTIENCTITLNKTNTNTTDAIYQFGNGTSSTPAPNSGNTYNNVTVNNAFSGIQLVGSSNSTNYDFGNTITGCTITNIGGSIHSATSGIGVSNQNGVTISSNIINNLSLAYQAVVYGIYVGGTSTGALNIYLNKVYNINNTMTGSSSARTYGMEINSVAGEPANVFSNCISALNTSESGTSTVCTIGLYFTSGGAATGNVYFNSIWLSGSYGAGVSDFYTDVSSGTLNIKENIFKYSGTQTNSSDKAYCIYLKNGSGMLNTEDYNIYDMVSFVSPYFTGNNSGDIGILTAWKNSTGKDVNSQQFFTQFVSTTDLHLAVYPSSSYTGLLADVSLINPSVDIDGQARVTPTIGADEVSVTTAPIVVISAPSQPIAANIAKGNTILLHTQPLQEVMPALILLG